MTDHYPDITLWTPLAKDTPHPKWCDGTAYQYPDDRPLTLTAFTQIVDTHRAIVTDSSVPAPTADRPLKKADIRELKTAIEADQFAYDWTTPVGDETRWTKGDANDLRRSSTYPNTTADQTDMETRAPEAYRLGEGVASHGFRWLYESPVDEGSPSGWQEFIGEKMADSGQSHRFWMWTRYIDSGIWELATVGPIGVDGTILAPIGGTPVNSYEDEFTDTPQTGDETTLGYWHLVQLVQDIEPNTAQLASVKKPLKGFLHMPASADEAAWEWDVEWGDFHTWEFCIDENFA